MSRLSYPPPFMDLTTLSEHISASESTIENWVKLGTFPAPRKQGGLRLWQWKEVERHLAGKGGGIASLPDALARGITNATKQATARQQN